MGILAVLSTDLQKVGGGAPIFYARDLEELEKLATLLTGVLGAAVHDLQNGVYVIVRH